MTTAVAGAAMNAAKAEASKVKVSLYPYTFHFSITIFNKRVLIPSLILILIHILLYSS